MHLERERVQDVKHSAAALIKQTGKQRTVRLSASSLRDDCCPLYGDYKTKRAPVKFGQLYTT